MWVVTPVSPVDPLPLAPAGRTDQDRPRADGTPPAAKNVLLEQAADAARTAGAWLGADHEIRVEVVAGPDLQLPLLERQLLGQICRFAAVTTVLAELGEQR